MTTSEISHINVQYSKTIGRGEQFGPGFTNPIFVARGKDDLMYVLCRASEYRPEGTRVTVCTTDEDYVSAFARGVAQQGPHEYNFEDGSLVWPTSIALDSEGNVFIPDEWLNRISKFSKDGEYLGKWEERVGTGDGEFDRPSGMVFDADDNAYIVDSGNNRVQKFTNDGKFLAKWGTAGSGDGEFDMPWGIAIDSHGDIYVADWRNDRIQRFTTQGELLQVIDTLGRDAGRLNRPSDVAIDAHGDLYVCDRGNDRVVQFNRAGLFIESLRGEAVMTEPTRTDARTISCYYLGPYYASPKAHRILLYGKDNIIKTNLRVKNI